MTAYSIERVVASFLKKEPAGGVICATTGDELWLWGKTNQKLAWWTEGRAIRVVAPLTPLAVKVLGLLNGGK